jgi:hypothetical protein
MAWTPSTTALGSTDENVNISYTPTYIDDSVDPITGLPGTTALPVTISATETHPTITVGSSISGYYADSFDYGITYKNTSKQIVNTTKFSYINNPYEIISYSPNMSASKIFTYTATAKSGSTVVSTQTYQVTVNNNWDTGKTRLKSAIAQTRLVSR